MPIYRVGIAYTETIRRYHQVLVAVATNDEAETITRGAFQRDEEVIVQGKHLGRMQEWEHRPVSRAGTL
jgi:hypothetical protein